MTGIVFGCIVPHPPIIIHDIGKGREQEIAVTIKAMQELAGELAAQKPQSMLIISPHGPAAHSAMGVPTAPASRGNLRVWGSRQADLHFTTDLELVAALQQEAKAADVPMTSIGTKSYELDHGVMVPMHFLIKGVKDVPLVPLTFSWLPLSTHFAFGQAIARATQRMGKKIALIASGDLSHRLTPDAPAGYDPEGKVFDQKLVEALGRFDTKAVLNLDPELVDRAGECGLRSIVILLGALDGLKVRPKVFSYEGPFGVGYMVASFTVEELSLQKEEQAMHPLVQLARESVESYVYSHRLPPKPKQLTPEMEQRAGVFVSIKKLGQLRGCIGTFEPTQPDVAGEIMHNAVNSATRDPRFEPVMAEELPYLTYSVDVLTKPEPVKSSGELDPKKCGVIVECKGRRGLLLPDLEGVDTVDDQIDICRRKAGIAPDEPVKLYRFEVKRYK